VRDRLRWRHEGCGFDPPPTAHRPDRDTALVHALGRDRDGRVAEHVVWFSTFDLLQVLLGDWSMPFPGDPPDPPAGRPARDDPDRGARSLSGSGSDE